MMKFEIGATYCAVPALEGARRRMVVVIGRSGNHIQLAWCDDLSVGEVAALDFGREFMQVSRPDGVYSVSAACRVDAADASEVMELVRPNNTRKEVNHGFCAKRGD